MENIATTATSTPVNVSTGDPTPSTTDATGKTVDTTVTVDAAGEVDAGSTEYAEQLAQMQADLQKAKDEVESARRHCQQKDDEMRKLKRKNLTDPDAIEELEREVEEERTRLLQEAEATKREYTIKSNMFDVKQTLTEAGVSSADSTKLAGFITGEDADESIARAKAIVSVINKVANGKVKDATNAMLKDNAEEPPNGGSPAAANQTISRGAAAAQRYAETHINNIGGKN